MHLRALALSVLIPLGVVTFVDRYPALVRDATYLLRSAWNTVS